MVEKIILGVLGAFLGLCAVLSFIGWLSMPAVGDSIEHEIQGVGLLACFGIFVIGVLLCRMLWKDRK